MNAFAHLMTTGSVTIAHADSLAMTKCQNFLTWLKGFCSVRHMRLVKFINNRTEELMHEQEKVKTYSLSRDAEGEALKTFLQISRSLLKFVMLFKIALHFIIVKFGVIEAPGAPLAEKKIDEYNKKLKKLGMKDLKILNSEKV